MRSSVALPSRSAAEAGPARAPGLLLAFVFVCAVFAERAQISIATGGRGLLPIVTLIAPVVAVATIARFGHARTLRFLSRPGFVLGVAPFLVLSALLPILGVIVNGYPPRTLLSVTDATTALSFLVIGAALTSARSSSWSRWLLLAIVIQLVYAAGQAVYLLRAPGWELFAPFHQWDVSQQDPLTFVQARSSGLYFNPNILGLWAALAVTLSATLVSPKLRIPAIALGILTLALSQSRGAMAALLAVVVVAGLGAVVQRRAFSATTGWTILGLVLATMAAVAVAVVIVPETVLEQRFGALLAVWAEGPMADANLAGRLDLWADAVRINVAYPWGTWGSPEMLLRNSVDSAWFRVFAQGSVPYLASLFLLLGTAFAIGRGRHGGALRLVVVLIAVAGLTQTPFGYPVIVLFWVLLGAELQAPFAATATSPRPRFAERGCAAAGPQRLARPPAKLGRASAVATRQRADERKAVSGSRSARLNPR